MQIKYLSRQGVPKSQIAKQLGVCRQTVYNHLEALDSSAQERPVRPSKLDAYKEHIRVRLEQFDLPVTVLFGELKDQGYRGGLTILREFVRPLKSKMIARVTERFETQPGHQGQLDWGECGTIEVCGEWKKVYVFVFVLGYSRMLYAQFTTSCRLPILLSCMQKAFDVLGIPEEVLVDNMKQAVDSHDVLTGQVRWNRRFLDFADHHTLLPVACPPYWPRVKGKVERGVGYIKSSFLEGRVFTDLADLNAQLFSWTDAVANCRTHGTTGERPIDRYQDEQNHLRALSAIPVYDTRPLTFRVVSSDCFVNFEGVRYSVDPVAVGQIVCVRPDGEDVGTSFGVYFNDVLIGHHHIRAKGSRPVMLAHHQQAIRDLTRGQANNAASNRQKQPRFEQRTASSIGMGLSLSPFQDAPSVQERSLAEYEHLLTGEVL